MCSDLIFNLLKRVQMAVFYFYAKHYFFCFHVLFCFSFMALFHGCGSNVPRLQSHDKERVYFFNLGTQIRCSQNRYTDLRSALDQPLLGYVWPLPSKTLTPSSRNFDVLLHSKTWLHPHFFLGYSKDIANFLLRVLTKCLIIPIKIIISICGKLLCLSGCKKSLTSFFKILQKKSSNLVILGNLGITGHTHLKW